MTERTWKTLSLLVSLILVGCLSAAWVAMNRYEPQYVQLVNEKAVDAYLQKEWEATLPAGTMPTVHVRTGIFIQSLKFLDSAEVNLSGYVWQHYKDGVHDAIKPKEGEAGWVFPEQVNSGNDIEPREVYRIRDGDEEVIGWYFEATVRQPFEYSTYPFDHKTVRLRMWAKDFSANVVLVPDFNAYKGTGQSDVFGIDQSIVLGTWQRANTFFDYHAASYDSNFGISGYVGQMKFPELRYNFVLRRRFGDAFVVYLLPLLMVIALLYGALLTVTDDPDKSERLGFSASNIIGSCSALFFVVLLAHMQLREQFAGASIVYIEYFYFFMYGLLVLGAAYSYLFAVRQTKMLGFLHDRDGMALKVWYWPLVLAAMLAITLFVLFTHTNV